MSVNTAHANNGVLIHFGEYILLHSDNVAMEFSGQDNSLFRGTKSGRIYLTSHRIIFNSKKAGDDMQSFSAPFIAMSDVDLEQPVFGANFIKGKVRAQPNGNFIGEVKFKLYFKSGGAIEYGMALLRAARTAQSNLQRGGFSDNPPPYTPSSNWYEAPPAAYQIPSGYYGWLPQHEAFTGPEPNSVFMSDNPPPYPGIGAPPAYNAPPPAAYTPAAPPRHPYNPNQTLAYNASQENVPNWNTPTRSEPQQYPNATASAMQQQEEMPSWNGFSLPPPNEEQFRQQQQQPQQAAAYPLQNPWAGVYPQNPYPYYPIIPGYPNQQGVPIYPPYPPYPVQNTPGYNMGFNNAPPPPNSKELEARASAFGNVASDGQQTSQPGTSNDVPPAYEDLPPPTYRNDGNRRPQ